LAALEQRSPPVAVVHLARRANGDAVLQSFLKSYFELSPGIEHDLIVVLKGYEHDLRAKELALNALRPHRAMTLEFPDDGLDLDAYRAAVNAFDYSYYCFVNSFSRPTAEGWLRQMMHWAQQPRVGIVGATGSYQSVFADEVDALTNVFVHHLGKLSKGAHSDPRSGGEWSRAPTSPRAPELGQATGIVRLPGRLWRATTFYLWRLDRCMRALWHFAAFPNAHIRTNGFILSRQVISRMCWPPTTTKFDAYTFESGRRGITAQVVRMGLEPVVVGRNGRGYFRAEWPGSDTFWQGDQDNLLISDNQTQQYALGPLELRRLLCRHAWRHLSTPNV